MAKKKQGRKTQKRTQPSNSGSDWQQVENDLHGLNSLNRMQLQLIENLQKEDLPPVEAAEAIQGLLKQNKLSLRQGAEKIGMKLTNVAELVGILRIQKKKLAKVKHLPKHALIEISKAKSTKEQDVLIAAALSAKKPMAEVKRTRAKANALQFNRTHYKIERYAGARVTVELPKSLKKVTPYKVLKEALKQSHKT